MSSFFRNYKYGIISFLIVLLLMPIGHTLMVLNEKILGDSKLMGAFIIGLIGVVCLGVGIRKNENKPLATIAGLMAGILLWTGWIEFSFVWMAEKLEVPPLMENGEVATKPEYLVMMSSLGLLLVILLFFLFSYTQCQFFNWFQNIFRIKASLGDRKQTTKLLAKNTFIETIMLLWTFYLVLLLVYDNEIAGSDHLATYIVAFGSLFWSIYLFINLLRIQKFDYAIRYAVPTVIIFWNFVEVIGRWDLLKEIWVHPKEHWLENLLIFVMLIGFTVYYLIETYRTKTQSKISGSNC